jgi:uncharacterized protein YjbJ (UPF0337 family)
VTTFEITRKIDKLHLFPALNILNSPPRNKAINTDSWFDVHEQRVSPCVALQMHLHMLHRLYRFHLSRYNRNQHVPARDSVRHSIGLEPASAKQSTINRRMKMNWDQIEGKWKQFKGSVKQQWGKVTDDDLDYIAGSRDKFVGKLQERYGFAKEDAERATDEWLAAQADRQQP